MKLLRGQVTETYRVYAKYERRVGFNHGWRIFDDTPQSVHIQV